MAEGDHEKCKLATGGKQQRHFGFSVAGLFTNKRHFVRNVISYVTSFTTACGLFYNFL